MQMADSPNAVDRLLFSSRRRHTRWPRDWSSDVCSSDLTFGLPESCSHRPLLISDRPVRGPTCTPPPTSRERSEERRDGKGCRSESQHKKDKKNSNSVTLINSFDKSLAEAVLKATDRKSD